MWSSNSENLEYSAQITPYHGKVHAEIIRRDSKENFGFHSGSLWLTVMDKEFGSSFRRAPTEEIYEKAISWVNKQLALIDKHGTCMIKKPEHMIRTDRIDSET